VKLTQRHFGDSIEVEFRDEEFDYTIKTSGSKKRFSVDYTHFDPAVVEESEQANTWWRNVGAAWVIIGGVFTAIRYSEGQGLRVSFWLYLGIVCLAVYRFGRTAFTHHALDGGGRVILIKNRKATELLGELIARRKVRLAAVYGGIDFDEDPDREIAKFKWLESQGALSSEDAADRIHAIRTAAHDTSDESDLGVN
jgi:hypothetical protein